MAGRGSIASPVRITARSLRLRPQLLREQQLGTLGHQLRAWRETSDDVAAARRGHVGCDRDALERVRLPLHI